MYEGDTWNCLLTVLLETPSDQIEEKVLEAIISMDKMNVIKSRREKCMLMILVVEQHHMVPFHDCWMQRRLKQEKNVEAIKRKMLERFESRSMHWLTDLLNELCCSQDTLPDLSCFPDFNFCTKLSKLHFDKVIDSFEA